MTNSAFIPAGRTSVVNKGDQHLQVQTEYARRPAPRITTTISIKGQVINKVERALDREIESVEEQSRVEIIMKRQHAEVTAILQNQPHHELLVPTKAAVVEPPLAAAPCTSVPEEVQHRLSSIPGVQQVFCLDNEGNFFSENGSEEFHKQFAPVFNHLRELMEVFSRIPGVSYAREPGVYEVERDRLYLASAQTECYFVIVRRINVTTNYEQEIKLALCDRALSS